LTEDTLTRIAFGSAPPFRSVAWVSQERAVSCLRDVKPTDGPMRSGDDELRFTYRSGAESWAKRLAERGLASELTWHDENVATATEADGNVA
jgi:hypothetical protein